MIIEFIALIACFQKYNSEHFVDKYLFFRNQYKASNTISVNKYLIFKNQYGVLNLISKNKSAYLAKRYKAALICFYALFYTIKIYLIIDMNFDLSELYSGKIKFKEINFNRLLPFEVFGVFCGIFETFNFLCYFLLKPSNSLIRINYTYSFLYICLYVHSIAKFYMHFVRKNNFSSISCDQDGLHNYVYARKHIVRSYILIAIKTLFIY